MAAPNPRRRPAASDPASDATGLPKGSTFHTSANTAQTTDPQLDVMNYPRRAPTSPRALEEMLDHVQTRVHQLGLQDGVSTSHQPRSRHPAFSGKHASSSNATASTGGDPFDINSRADRVAARSGSDHSHDSDSGIGSSVSADDSMPSSPELKSRSVKPAARKMTKSVYTPQPSALDSSVPHVLSQFAQEKADILVFRPLLAHRRLEDFHGLVKKVREGVSKGSLICLRDIEKSLILQAPVSHEAQKDSEIELRAHTFGYLKSKSDSPSSYLVFAETAVQCVHTTAQHLAGRDLTRPADKPYTNTYFIDLIEQIRQYARIMEAHRITREHGSKSKAKAVAVDLDESGLNSMGERVRLEGGFSKDGEPLRLVREDANGNQTEIEVTKQALPSQADADGERSMARKRKCDIGKIDIKTCRECGKEFTRSCDLTKHEKTHSRPWKCPEASCDYSQSGFATEKECERHFNDKHDPDPKMYGCLFEGCNYLSKRESNCKQHMEKTHGWDYIRSKSKKDANIIIPMFRQSELKQLMNTPTSMGQSVATPSSSHLGSSVATPASTHLTYSPAISSNAISPITVPDSTMTDVNIFDHSLMGDDFAEPYEDGSFDFHHFGNELGMARSGSLQDMVSPDGDFGALTASNLAAASFDANGNMWPQVDDYFESYNLQPTQQPTPAYSDHKDFGGMDGTVSGDQLLQKQAAVLTPNSQANDFEMYGQGVPAAGQNQASSHAESSAMGASFFPELGNVDLQFDPMFNGMSESADTVDFSKYVNNSQE